jgi:uncharacterized protein (DUF2236 family)
MTINKQPYFKDLAVKEYFVEKDSVVRQIWGKSDTILFIFAGAAAEFAVNKAVDWLYFTGRLPADPLGRLFSTVSYSRAIVFSDKAGAHRAIDAMASIHANVEAKRGAHIPDWAYADVLFLLIDYSIRAFEVLERRLTEDEKDEVFKVFYRIGHRMGIAGLPETFADYQLRRQKHLHQNLHHSFYTDDLFAQYRKHLGVLRYTILIEVQIMIIPERVRQLLCFRKTSLLLPLLTLYRISRFLKVDWVLRELLLPKQYEEQIKQLDKSQIAVH